MSIENAVPTIAIIAMANSVHTGRWLSMIRGRWARIIVVPVYAGDAQENIRPDAIIRSSDDVLRVARGQVGLFDLDTIDWNFAAAVDKSAGYVREPHPAFPPQIRVATAHHITSALRLIEPDLVHSMEVQIAGYLTLEAKRRLGAAAPPWLLSNWGSDVFLFRKASVHRKILQDVFLNIDGYWSECRRDVQIAREFGYDGVAFDPVPASGGMISEDIPQPQSSPSGRKTILVKGYHGWAGRGMHILSALYLAAGSLRDYKIKVTFPSVGMAEMVASVRDHAGLDMEIVPHLDNHAEVMLRLSHARMVVGLGISDGISTTLLEAMAVGAFPILATTSCACEWVTDGQDGFIVDPHDVAGLAAAITKAALDDDLVDRAAPRNQKEVWRRWNPQKNGRTALANYRSLIEAAMHSGNPWRPSNTFSYAP